MKILHTSDWHLGKRLFKLERTEEHALFLDWILRTLKDKQIDVLLVAGDIFDVPSPPHESQAQYYEFLERVSRETAVQTFVISGNHDSGVLLEAPAPILRQHRVKVWGRLSEKVEDHWVRIQVRDEVLDLCALPFFRSYELLPQGDEDPLAQLRKYLRKERTIPQFLMLHHLAGIPVAGGSEQVISLSGIGFIPLEEVEPFDYVALGHIHKPQKMAGPCYYSGSPFPMRFSETSYGKSINLIELKQGKISVSVEPVPVFRELFTVRATLENWEEKINALDPRPGLRPVAEVQLQLTEPKIGLVEAIKAKLDSKGIDLLSYLPNFDREAMAEKKTYDLFNLSTDRLFEEFYKTKYPEAKAIPEDLKRDFFTLLEKVRHASQET